MKYTLLAVAVFGVVSAASARAGVSLNLSTNPLTNPGVVIKGPDAANAASRFTYNAADDTLTAHYNTGSPTIMLELPLGQHYTENTSFVVTSSFELKSSGFVSPTDFSASIASFGLVNSVTTGAIRASTSDADFNEVVQGNSFDLMTFDYFPTQTFGNSVALTTLQSQNAVAGTFDDHFAGFNSTDSTLPFDQFITASIAYNAQTHDAHMTWGGNAVDVDLTGAVFDTDSLALFLWNDPGPTAQPPAVAFGEPVAADVVFDSLSAQVVPEPASLGLFVVGALALVRRRRQH